jgi:hypothetical protein
VLVDTSRDLGPVLGAVDAFLAVPEPVERAAGDAGASPS